VQKAIDDKSKLGVFDDLNKLLKMKAAMALENAALNQGEAGSAMGMGMGFMMPAMFADAFRSSAMPQATNGEVFHCPDCQQTIPKEARFCPACGHQILVFQQCPHCGENLPTKAKFCIQCGKEVEQKPQPKKCLKCGTENLPNSMFCNQCGERIQHQEKGI
jgi:membrane protease subunit (stomatin/prohibitin family)